MEDLPDLHEVEARNVGNGRVGDDAKRFWVGNGRAKEVGEDQINADKGGLKWVDYRKIEEI